jgi:hypothetical protein
LPKRWHHDSIYGDGPRRPLNREERAQWRGRITWLHALGQITRGTRDIGLVLADFLGADGRLDPSHDAIARRAHACPRTVRTALACLSRLGAVSWVRRLVRCGDRVAQTSNAYLLLIGPALSGGNCCRGSGKKVLSTRAAKAERAAKGVLKGVVAALRGEPDLLLRRRQAWEARWRGAV